MTDSSEKIDTYTNFATTAGKVIILCIAFKQGHWPYWVPFGSCESSPHSLDVPDNFQDVSDNENCGIFYLIISREEVFAGMRF